MDNLTPMPFGKHKGTPLRGLPDDYLAWLRAKATVKVPELGDAIDDEHYRRLRGEQPEEDEEVW